MSATAIRGPFGLFKLPKRSDAPGATPRAPKVRKRSKGDADPAGLGPSHYASPRRPRRRPSFTDDLPWVEYDPEEKSILLENGISVGAIYEITPKGTDGATDEVMQDVCNRAQDLVGTVIREEAKDHWIVQWYVTDEFHDTAMEDRIRSYRGPGAVGSKFSDYYMNVLADHVGHVCRPGGHFAEEDNTVWRGRRRRYFMALQRFHQTRRLGNLNPDGELSRMTRQWEQALRGAAVPFKRMDGKGFYDLMVAWLNPRPAATNGSVAEYLRRNPYPGDDNVPYGRDFSAMLVGSCPTADADEGVIYLDGLPHSCVTTQGLRRAPNLGAFTGEQVVGSGDEAKPKILFDQFPEGSILSIATIYAPQDVTEDHIDKVEKASLSGKMEADLAREDCETVRYKMAKGDALYPTEVCVYVRGEDLHDLRIKQSEVQTLLRDVGFNTFNAEDQLLVLDRWFDNLPLAYRPTKLKTHGCAKLSFSSHVARLLPIFGRERGTGNPGLTFFNRGGETLTLDPLNRRDRKKAAHLFLFGPTGAGKSATLVHLLLNQLAANNPKIVVIDRGHSFDLFGDFCAKWGLTTHRVDLSPGSGVSLPPFAEASRLLNGPKATRPTTETDIEAADSRDEKDAERILSGEGTGEEKRDIAGETELLARLMITGGEEDEIKRLGRSDRAVIRNAIRRAAQTARDEGAPTTLTEHVVGALRDLSKEQDDPTRRARVADMAESMSLYCDQNSLGGQLFNRPGEAWPEADVTIVELGALANEGNEGDLAIAYVSLMNTIAARVERDQATNRNTIVVTDEAHLITTNPLLVKYVVKITKMWRKLGAWYWLATQNLSDFPEEAKKMLSLAEFWICLNMTNDEAAQVEEFRTLNAAQRSMLRSTTKEFGKFTEGVVLQDTRATLARIVLPKITLKLVGTEQDEKEERATAMREQGLANELEAAEWLAEEAERKERAS